MSYTLLTVTVCLISTFVSLCIILKNMKSVKTNNSSEIIIRDNRESIHRIAEYIVEYNIDSIMEQMISMVEIDDIIVTECHDQIVDRYVYSIEISYNTMHGGSEGYEYNTSIMMYTDIYTEMNKLLENIPMETLEITILNEIKIIINELWENRPL